MTLLNLPVPDDLPDLDAGDDELARALKGLGEVDEAAVATAVDPLLGVDPTLGRVEVAIGVVDLTTLEGTDTPGRVAQVCARAVAPDDDDPACPSPAAVCVYSDMVGAAVEALGDSDVRVAAVAGGFPAGRMPLPVRVADVEAAVAAGAAEIDAVLDRGAFLDGRLGEVVAQVRALKEAAGDTHLKLILEASELGTLTVLRRAAWLALAAGADVVKTSTGKSSSGSTPERIAVLADTAAAFGERSGREVGVKAAGGVRTVAQASGHLAVVAAVAGDDWLVPERFRIGASSLLDALVERRRRFRGRG